MAGRHHCTKGQALKMSRASAHGICASCALVVPRANPVPVHVHHETQHEPHMTTDWIPDLTMGDPDVDEQHKVLIDMIRELAAQINAGEQRQGVLDTLQGMLAYAADHFEAEEEMMEDADWEGLDRHEGLHAEFLWKAGEFEAQLKTSSSQASSDVPTYLLQWLVEHINVEDRAFFKPTAV